MSAFLLACFPPQCSSIIPSSGDDDSDEDEERPMSRDELKAKTLRGMSKRCVT
jgi:hypothetical protein